jgi:hypothetical protein
MPQGARKAGVSKDDPEPTDGTNLRGVSWIRPASPLRGAQDEAVGSCESFPALNAKVPAARPPP